MSRKICIGFTERRTIVDSGKGLCTVAVVIGMNETGVHVQIIRSFQSPNARGDEELIDKQIQEWKRTTGCSTEEYPRGGTNDRNTK